MSLKSWGLELWDQVDKVFVYCNQGLEQAELFHKTISDIHKIYCGLAKKHKALNLPTNVGKSKLVLDNSTYLSSFNKFLNCMSEQASLYETQAEEMKNQAVVVLKSLIDDIKAGISTQNSEYSKFKASVENHKKTLDRAWSKYYASFVIRRKAEANFLKIKDDKTVPRIEIDKVQNVASQKVKEFEKARAEYALAIQIFNDNRAQLYLKDLPKLCSALELLDRKRAEITRLVGDRLVEINKAMLNQSAVYLVEDIRNAIGCIDHRTDSKNLIECLSSSGNPNLLQPPDVIFVNLESFTNHSTINLVNDVPGLAQQGGKVERNDVAKSLFGGSLLKGIEMKELLPEQVKRRIQDLEECIKVMDKQLAGLKTLFATFEKDPAMGDKNSLEPEIDVNERQLTSLRQMEVDIKRHREGMPDNRSNGGSKTNNNPSVAQPMKRGKSTSSSAAGGESDDSFEDDEDEAEEVARPMPQRSGNGSIHSSGSGETKMAKVLYGFDAVDDQQMSIMADTTIIVLAYDDGGSGWTLGQNPDDKADKGYVPTNYIQLI